MVAGYFNTNLEIPEGGINGEDIVVDIVAAGMEDISAHFLPRLKPWSQYGSTWCMRRLGREVRSWTDYVREFSTPMRHT